MPRGSRAERTYFVLHLRTLRTLNAVLPPKCGRYRKNRALPCAAGPRRRAVISHPVFVDFFYCRETHSFTVPFLATSVADPHAVIADIWPEPWVLPFSIEDWPDHL